MASIESDIGYVRAALPILKDYLFSNEIYWSLGVAPPPGELAYPQLTLGGILLAHARLQVRRSDPRAVEEYPLLEAELEKIQLQIRVSWEKKCEREFGARLKLWRDYLEEYRSQPENHSDRYAYEVTRRVMLDLLQLFARDLPTAEIKLLQGLDQLLHAVFIPGKFIWEPDLKDGFPKPRFWYLYGDLQQTS
ncbi:MAG: hypothetical protein JSV61_02820 [Anaerolineales bacterium]|nr:MAG: hypothetical protein JSV61_02820 [Anaerolineales bacterium]